VAASRDPRTVGLMASSVCWYWFDGKDQFDGSG
jgi:hypothetical protein